MKKIGTKIVKNDLTGELANVNVIDILSVSNENGGAVQILPYEGGGGEKGAILQFITPIRKVDYRNGKPYPRALAWRSKNQLVTAVAVRQGALEAIRKMLNDLAER